MPHSEQMNMPYDSSIKSILIGNMSEMKNQFRSTCPRDRCKIYINDNHIELGAFTKINLEKLSNIVKSTINHITTKCKLEITLTLTQTQVKRIKTIARQYRCSIQYNSNTNTLLIINKNPQLILDEVYKMLGIYKKKETYN